MSLLGCARWHGSLSRPPSEAGPDVRDVRHMFCVFWRCGDDARAERAGVPGIVLFVLSRSPRLVFTREIAVDRVRMWRRRRRSRVWVCVQCGAAACLTVPRPAVDLAPSTSRAAGPGGPAHTTSGHIHRFIHLLEFTSRDSALTLPAGTHSTRWASALHAACRRRARDDPPTRNRGDRSVEGNQLARPRDAKPYLSQPIFKRKKKESKEKPLSQHEGRGLGEKRIAAVRHGECQGIRTARLIARKGLAESPTYGR